MLAAPAGHAVVLVDTAFAEQVVGIAAGRTPDTPAVGNVGSHSALEAEGSRKPAGGERIAAVGEVVVHTPAVLLQCRKPAAGAAAGKPVGRPPYSIPEAVSLVVVGIAEEQD